MAWGIFYEIALRWLLLDLINDKSTLLKVMAWYRQAMMTQLHVAIRRH